MAVTIHADPSSRLLRAIGYSVGSEWLVSRVKILVDAYVHHRKIDSLIWNSLVSERFGRKAEARPGKKSAADHMADMYSSLGLLYKFGNQLFPGPALDSLSILRRDFIDDEDGFDRALKAIVCFQILERDGDIFVNCLAACFEEQATEKYLNEMLHAKRQIVADVIRTPDLLRKVLDRVSIRNLDTSLKRATSSALTPFAKRTTPLMGTVQVEESISNDYLKKSPARRRRWAEDIGLFASLKHARLTDRGTEFLAQISKSGLKLRKGAFAIWAYEPDLLYLRIFPEQVGIPKLSSWDLCEIVAGTYANRSNSQIHADSLSKTLDFLVKCKDSYSKGNELKGSIRHQIPINIVYNCLLGLASANNRQITNLPACLELEARGKERRFSKVHIRGTEGAIEVKSKGR